MNNYLNANVFTSRVLRDMKNYFRVSSMEERLRSTVLEHAKVA
jgi:hypothetical protein